jgi:hypothetical protein
MHGDNPEESIRYSNVVDVLSQWDVQKKKVKFITEQRNLKISYGY